jgi:hypothetical protein
MPFLIILVVCFFISPWLAFAWLALAVLALGLDR